MDLNPGRRPVRGKVKTHASIGQGIVNADDLASDLQTTLENSQASPVVFGQAIWIVFHLETVAAKLEAVAVPHPIKLARAESHRRLSPAPTLTPDEAQDNQGYAEVGD
jgi:hypothetical protein